MATVIIMPKQGQSVESCILTEVKKKKGDHVAVGDVLFSYETDKASFEETAQVAGVILEVFFSEGDEIPVLTNVLVIGVPGEPTEEFRPLGGNNVTHPKSPAVETFLASTAAVTATSPATPSFTPVISGAISPRARLLADK